MQRYEAIRADMLGNTQLKCNNSDLALLYSQGMIALNMEPCINDPAIFASDNQIIQSNVHVKCARILSRMASSAMAENH